MQHYSSLIVNYPGCFSRYQRPLLPTLVSLFSQLMIFCSSFLSVFRRNPSHYFLRQSFNTNSLMIVFVIHILYFIVSYWIFSNIDILLAHFKASISVLSIFLLLYSLIFQVSGAYINLFFIKALCIVIFLYFPIYLIIRYYWR